MKTLLFTALTAGALLMGTASASALSGVSGGWHCWFTVSAQTCYWPHEGEPYYNLDGSRNVKVDALPEETDLVMWGNPGGNPFDPNAWKEYFKRENWHVGDEPITQESAVSMLKPRSEIKYWACMNGATGYTMQNKNSPCKYTPRPVYGRIGSLTTGTGETTIAMMTPEMVDSWRSTLERHYDYSAVDLDETYTTQLAFRGRGSTCSSNPYGRRSFYCNDSEVQSPVPTDVTASVEFGSCLLNDEQIILEEMVDCRSDACLGRKFYYGSFGKVGR